MKDVGAYRKVKERGDQETRWITSPSTLSSKRAKRLRKVLDRVRTIVLISIWAIQNVANEWKHPTIKLVPYAGMDQLSKL